MEDDIDRRVLVSASVKLDKAGEFALMQCEAEKDSEEEKEEVLATGPYNQADTTKAIHEPCWD